MIRIILERFIEKEFHLEDAKDVAPKLYDLGYELERDAELVDAKPNAEKVKALLKILKKAKPEAQTTVTIQT